MMPAEDFGEDDYGVNPYESFMKKHLQHYGYYTGKNQNYKNQFQQYAEWEKNYAYNLSSSSDDSDSDSDDDDKNADNKLQEELLRTTQLIYSCGESGKMVPRLREPRSLYALNKELGPQQAARWPSDLQVINERICHLQTVNPEPEPLYKLTGYEKAPMVRGETNGGRIVFGYETNSSFFMKSRVGGSRNGCDPCAVSLESEKDTTLVFESRFESGNLGKAVQIGESEYELWLRYDLYTNKHTQWFYFRVSNTRADKEYRFTIVNFMKPDSLYNNGMKPVMYSEKEAALNKVGWVREGQNIKYYKNNVRYEMGRADRNYYSMTWTVRLKHDHDTVYFAHCYPYTYTDLQDYLLEVTNDPIKSRICKQRVLCRTLAGNLVYVLTITSASQNPEDMKHKKAVVVTSRVHPGESNASWMMKGFLDFVTGNSPDAKLLRDTFIIKVVPMLNPDGVIVGNYRCSLAGRDLNRNYKTSLKDAYPSVWHTKTMIRKLLLERDIIVYCDLHGHSRRQNVFIYGCEHRHGSNKRFHEKVFPSMLNKNTPEKFCFKSCKFKVQKSKEGTGRVVMWNMGIMNSYTLEATFCGSSLGKKKGFHFSQQDFEMMGYHFCDTLLDYCDPDNTKYAKIMVDLEDKHQMEVMTKIARKGLQPDSIENLSDISTDTESSDGGSDSSASDGPPVHLQFAAARPKKKKLKSKKDRDRVHKEELKKVPAQEDKRMRNNQVKPLRQELRQGQPIRYTSTSPKRPRSLDDRTNSGIPVFVQERFDEKQQKRHDYLEALTAAYISNNIPIVNDPAFVKLDRNYTKGDAAFKISRLVGRKEVPQTDTPNMEDLLRAHLAHPASINPLDRRHKPHLLEVSAAQQRQTDALSKNKDGPIKTHPNPFEDKTESARKAAEHPKAHIPATSYVNYNTFNVTPVKEPNAQNGDGKRGEEEKVPRKNGYKDRDRSGRKSRKGMRESDEDGEDEFRPQPHKEDFDTRIPQSQPPRIKSAHTSRNMATALSSIQEIQKSLQSPRGGEPGAGDGNQAAGEYIQKLIQETNEEIQDLTNEIQEDIEKKHQTKSKDVNSTLAPHPKREKQIHKQPSDFKGARVPMGMGYHGSTFVNDLGSDNRYGDGYLAGRSAQPQKPQIKTSSQWKSTGEPFSYSGSSLPNTDQKKLGGGPNLVVANNRHRETPIEQEARTRSLKRQASSGGVFSRNNNSHGNGGNSNNNSPLVREADKEVPSPASHFLSDTPIKDQELNSSPYYRQLSSSHHNQQISQSASGLRLNKHNLVFKAGGPVEVAKAPAERGQSQLSDNQDIQGLDIMENGEQTRSRSARSSSRQVIETVPTKISLMICRDHQGSSPTPSGHFHPISRQGLRPPLYRQQGRKK